MLGVGFDMAAPKSKPDNATDKNHSGGSPGNENINLTCLSRHSWTNIWVH